MLVTNNKLYSNADVGLCKANLTKLSFDAVSPYFNFPITKWFFQQVVNGNQMGNTRAAIPNDSRLKKILYSPLISRSLLFVGVTSQLTREILQYYGIYNQMGNTRAAIPNDSRLKKILYSPLISRSLLFVGVTSLLTREILQYYGIYNGIMSGAILVQKGLSVLSCICVGQNAVPKLWNNLKNFRQKPKEAALSSALQVFNLAVQYKITKEKIM